MKDEINDEVVPKLAVSFAVNKVLQDMQTGANQIDRHEEYIIRGLMKGNPDEKMVPAELSSRSWF